MFSQVEEKQSLISPFRWKGTGFLSAPRRASSVTDTSMKMWDKILSQFIFRDTDYPDDLTSLSETLKAGELSLSSSTKRKSGI